VEAWLRAGRRIKGDWTAMLDAMRSRSREKVKLPFVPLRVSGKGLELVVRDLLKVLFGPNPSLLTVIVKDEQAIKAYAEDGSSGIYERLIPLEFGPGATTDALAEIACASGVEIGVVKEADVRFFELFEDEPEELLEALGAFVHGMALALREGWLSFEPVFPLARGCKLLAVSRESLRFVLSHALAPGKYALGFSCSGGSCALVVEAGEASWSAEEIEVQAEEVGPLARELVERHGCGAAVSMRLAAFGGLIQGKVSLEEFLLARGNSWELVTRSGLEGLLGAGRWAVKLLGLERDFEECNISAESLVSLARGYLNSAREYARRKGLGMRLFDGRESVDVVWDSSGIHEAESPDALKLDLRLFRGVASTFTSDPLEGVRRLVPREVMDEVSYTTAVALIECERPRGRLLLFGGPHQFFRRGWEGDACGILLDDGGNAHVVELPSKSLAIEDEGRSVGFAGEGIEAELRFERVRSRTDLHGAGRFFGEGKLAGWVPGLEVNRRLYRFVSGRVRADGKELSAGWGWMYLEEGEGRLLRWPFGATWLYSSWLLPSGECGSGVHAAPMLAHSTPPWLRRVMEMTVDGAGLLSPHRGLFSRYYGAMEPGQPVRVTRDSACAQEVELRYRVLSAVAVPFDEYGQVIFRLRCLCGDGAGLVEIPANLPGLKLLPQCCEVIFTERALSIRAEGRELLLVETGGRQFLMPYEPPAVGVWRRATRAAGKLFGRK